MQNEVQRNLVLGIGLRDSALLHMQGDVVEGNGGTGLCVRGHASVSLESCACPTMWALGSGAGTTRKRTSPGAGWTARGDEASKRLGCSPAGGRA